MDSGVELVFAKSPGQAKEEASKHGEVLKGMDVTLMTSMWSQVADFFKPVKGCQAHVCKDFKVRQLAGLNEDYPPFKHT